MARNIKIIILDTEANLEIEKDFSVEELNSFETMTGTQTLGFYVKQMNDSINEESKQNINLTT